MQHLKPTRNNAVFPAMGKDHKNTIVITDLKLVTAEGGECTADRVNEGELG